MSPGAVPPLVAQQAMQNILNMGSGRMLVFDNIEMGEVKDVSVSTWSDSTGTYTIDGSADNITVGDYTVITDHTVPYPETIEDPPEDLQQQVQRLVADEMARRLDEEFSRMLRGDDRGDEPPGLLGLQPDTPRRPRRVPYDPPEPVRRWKTRTQRQVRRIRL